MDIIFSSGAGTTIERGGNSERCTALSVTDLMLYMVKRLSVCVTFVIEFSNVVISSPRHCAAVDYRGRDFRVGLM